MKRGIWLFTWMILLLTGCAEHNFSAKDTTEMFWKTVMENDLQKAKELTVYNDIDGFSLPDNMKIASYKVGDVIENETNARVQTTLKLSEKENENKSEDIVFETILLKIGEKWKVDFEKTSQNFYDEVAKKSAKEITNTIFSAFMNGMSNVKEIEKAFKEGFKQMNEQMQKALKEMQKELEKMKKCHKMNVAVTIEDQTDQKEETMATKECFQVVAVVGF